MKTSILYGLGALSRAYLPSDDRDDDYHEFYGPPIIIPKQSFYSTVLGSGVTRRKTDPEMILIGSTRFKISDVSATYAILEGLQRRSYPTRIKRGQAEGDLEFKQPRVIDPESVEQIHKFDEAIGRLMEYRRETIEAAWCRGRPLKKSECIRVRRTRFGRTSWEPRNER